MSDERFATIEVCQQVFCAAAYLIDACALKTLDKAHRERKPDIGAAGLCAHNHSPLHDGSETGPDCFDFGKLWH